MQLQHSQKLSNITNTMVYNNYILNAWIEWSDGSISTCNMDYPGRSLQEVFQNLYKDVVTSSITDDELLNPEMINSISISLTRKRLKAKTITSPANPA